MFSNRWRRETNPDFWCNQQQVCVQIPTSADNVAQPTSGRCTPLWCDCCWPPACCAAIDWYLLAARPTAANRQQQRTTARWDRQRQLDWHKTVSFCITMQAMRNNKYWQWEYESDPALPDTTVHNDILWAHWCLCVCVCGWESTWEEMFVCCVIVVEDMAVSEALCNWNSPLSWHWRESVSHSNVHTHGLRQYTSTTPAATQ